ncbi:MAG: DinB family protein [Flavobacteriaceae bacterium]
MKEETKLRSELISNAIYRLDESTRMIEKSLSLLKEEEIWKRPNQSSNSVGNQILHLCGNIGQYVISSLGNSPDIRERDKEFSTVSGLSKDELLKRLKEVVDKAKKIIASSTKESLEHIREVQGFSLSGVGIVLHAVEHYSYHTGQIAFWTKLLKDEDLGFYDGIDLNIKNE